MTALFAFTGPLTGFAPDETQAVGIVGFVIGALVWPLWRLSRRIADRVVFGGRASPYEVLTEFAERVGETYQAEDVLPRMAQVLATATGATTARVWLRVGGELRPEASWPAGAPVAPSASMSGDRLPDLGTSAWEVRHRGELLGALSVEMPANDPMNDSKDRLARDLASQAGLVLRNVRLVEDLRRSRKRIVAAQDERARKLERDIHDGAQQQLVALSVRLRLAEQLARTEPGRAASMLADLQAEAGAALENLRDLARGIYPPLLADQGLAAALRAQARRSAVPTTVDGDGVGRFPQELEAAVYFCCLEAMNNATKHADATRVSIRLRAADGHLVFEVADDGAGFAAATAAQGTGLQGMSDRLDAIGGELRIESSPGEGTRIVGRVPVSPT